MIIGVDAAVLSVQDDRLKVGVYKLALRVLQELSYIDTKNSYRLYSFDPIPRSIMDSLGDSMENRVLWPVRGWASVRLPFELKLHPVDVFLGMSQMVPINAHHAIGFIYDIGYLHRKISYPGSFEKLKKQTSLVVTRSEHIITISESVKRDIIQAFGIQKTKISVAYPGVDEEFLAADDVHSDTKAPYFLFVGALKPGKNVPGLIQGFAKFLASHTDAPHSLYLIGGNYWEDPLIDEVISKHHLEQRVKKLGYVPGDELPSYYQRATALVSPSYHEGFCLPAVEAIASGCPVIASDQDVMHEVLGDAGSYVDPKNYDQIAQSLETIAYNTKKRRSLVLAGKKQVKRYSWKQFGRIILHAIETNRASI